MGAGQGISSCCPHLGAVRGPGRGAVWCLKRGAWRWPRLARPTAGTSGGGRRGGAGRGCSLSKEGGGLGAPREGPGSGWRLCFRGKGPGRGRGPRPRQDSVGEGTDSGGPTRGPESRGHLLVVGVLGPEAAAGGLPAQVQVRQPVQKRHPPGRRVAHPGHGARAARLAARGSSLRSRASEPASGFKTPPSPTRPPASCVRALLGPARLGSGPGSARLGSARLRSAACARRLFVRRRRRPPRAPALRLGPAPRRHWPRYLKPRPPGDSSAAIGRTS